MAAATLPGLLVAGDGALELSDGVAGFGRDRARGQLDVEGVEVVEPFNLAVAEISAGQTPDGFTECLRGWSR